MIRRRPTTLHNLNRLQLTIEWTLDEWSQQLYALETGKHSTLSQLLDELQTRDAYFDGVDITVTAALAYEDRHELQLALWGRGCELVVVRYLVDELPTARPTSAVSWKVA